MKNFKTVYSFEFRQFLKKKSTIIMTVIYFLFALGVTFVPIISSSFDSKESSNENFERSGYVIKDVSLKTDNFKDAKKYDNKETLKQDIKDGKIDEGLVFTKDSYEHLSKSAIITTVSNFNKVFDDSVKRYVYNKNSINYDNIQKVNDTVPIANKVDVDDSNSFQKSVNSIIIYVITIVTYMTTLLFATTVATNVVKEKANKAMELLLVTVKPKTLILGKVLALTSAILLQIALIIAGSFIGLKINMTKYGEQVKLILNNIDYKLVVVGIAFAITGIVMLMFLYTAFASLASRIEDVNSTVTIPTILVIIAFVANFAVINMPNSKFSQIVSYIPFTSYLAMPARYAMTTISNDDLIISYAILFVTTILIALASVRVYRLASLRTGKKLNFLKLLLG